MTKGGAKYVKNFLFGGKKKLPRQVSNLLNCVFNHFIICICLWHCYLEGFCFVVIGSLKYFCQVGAKSHFGAPFGATKVQILILCHYVLFTAVHLAGYKHSSLSVVTICFSLSSASPAHSPKEEYVITQSADTAKEEPVHDHSEDQGEPQEDRSELTERKPVTG